MRRRKLKSLILTINPFIPSSIEDLDKYELEEMLEELIEKRIAYIDPPKPDPTPEPTPMRLLYFRRLDEDTHTYGYYRLETHHSLEDALELLNTYDELEEYHTVFLGFNEWPGGSADGYESVEESDIPQQLLRTIDWRAAGI